MPPFDINEHLNATAKALSKSEVNPAPVTPKVSDVPTVKKEQAKITKWDAEIKPLLEKAGLADNFNYKNSLELMKVVNGRYDKFAHRLKTEDPKLYETYKQFSDNAGALVAMIKAGKTNQADFKLLDKYRNAASNHFSDLSDMLQDSEKSYWKIDDKYNIVSKPKFEQTFDGIVKLTGFTQSKQVNEDGELVDRNDGYLRLKNIEKVQQSRLMNYTKPLVTSWINLGVQNINTPNKSADDTQNAHAIAIDLVNHVAQYGTKSNKFFADKDKNEALKIAAAVYNKPYEEQINIIKSNSDVLSKMSERLGFYGTMSLYNKHKNGLGKNIAFYPTVVNGKTKDEYFKDKTIIENYRKSYNRFKNEGDFKLREQAEVMVMENRDLDPYLKNIQGSNSDFKLISSSILDAKNNIVSFDKWVQNINASDYDRLKKESVRWTEGGMAPDMPQSFESTSTRLARQQYGSKKAMGDNVVESGLKEIYANAVKGYKKQFDKINAKSIWENSNITGFGSSVSDNFGTVGLNLTLDKNKNLVSTTYNKQQNVNKLLSLMKNKNGEWINENVTAFGTADTNNGFNSIQASDLYDQSKLTKGVLETFFNSKDLSHVNMELMRNTNVPGKVAYMFYNTKTDKKMTIFLNKSKVQDIKEHVFIKTSESPEQFEFELEGKMDMPDAPNIGGVKKYENAVITRDPKTGAYVGHVKYLENGDVKSLDYPIPGSYGLNINAAYKLFSQTLNNL